MKIHARARIRRHEGNASMLGRDGKVYRCSKPLLEDGDGNSKQGTRHASCLPCWHCIYVVCSSPELSTQDLIVCRPGKRIAWLTQPQRLERASIAELCFTSP